MSEYEFRRDVLILVFSIIGTGILVCMMPGEPPAIDVALQWIRTSQAFAGECRP